MSGCHTPSRRAGCAEQPEAMRLLGIRTPKTHPALRDGVWHPDGEKGAQLLMIQSNARKRFADLLASSLFAGMTDGMRSANTNAREFKKTYMPSYESSCSYRFIIRIWQRYFRFDGRSPFHQLGMKIVSDFGQFISQIFCFADVCCEVVEFKLAVLEKFDEFVIA